MRYRVLGVTRALRPDGTPVPVGGARLRALLAALARRPGRTVPAAVLVDDVWGDEPPADAPGALQALVGRLRRALGADAVASAEGGYQLRAVPDDVDAYRFERLVGEGTRALADGDPAKAAAALDDALALWQGEAFADLPERAAEASRWAARRLEARRARLAAAVALGAAESALPEITALCATHPLDEPLQALRLRALRAAGRGAEALAAYDDVRRVLADRLGTDAGPELRGLYEELLNGDGARGGGAASGSASSGAVPSGPASSGPASSGAVPSGPAPSGSVSFGSAPSGSGPSGSVPSGAASPGAASPGAASSGAASSGQVSSGAAPSGSGPVRSVPPAPGADGVPPPGAAPAADGVRTAVAATAPRPEEPPEWPARPPAPAARGNLRARLTSFVGRAKDIDAIRADLARARLVTLVGPGGAGKTRLSQEVAEGVRAPDGVWLAELAPVDDPDDVPEAVLTALGARETVLRGAGAEELRAAAERHAGDPLARLTEYCAPRGMLLVLDNCEHVVDAAARLADRLLAHCPGLTVLATSREPLGVPGEVLRPVDPLPEPFALRLLADRGRAARPDFRVTDDPEAVAEICRRLDGLPLAIELAAARLRMLTPRQIADRLDDRFRLLTSGARTVLPRQQTLRAVVDWSWDLLDAAERAVLRRLSVCAGGCDLAAAEAVCASPGGPAPGEPAPGGPAAEGPRVDPRDVPGLLGSLVDKSLVVAAPAADGGGMRYRLLETVSEYAAERLDEAGERAAAERAHLVHFRELARRADPELRGRGQRAAIRTLETEHENLRTALRRAVAARDEQEALCLVLSLAGFWLMRDLRVEARHWSREVAALGPDPFTPPVAPVTPLHERCTDAPPPMRPEVLQEARRGVHLVQMACMDLDPATWQTPQGARKLRAVREAYRPGLPQACRSPGTMWIYAVLLGGDVAQVMTIVDETVAACRAFGYTWELAGALQWRANMLANRVDWAGDARRDADEALEIYTRLGDTWGTAEALASRGEAHERRGDYRRAAEDFRAAIAYAEDLGAKAQVSLLTARLGAVLLEAGETERGEALLRRVVREGGAGRMEGALPAARIFLVGLLGTSGRVAEAREHLTLLRSEFKAIGFAVFEGVVLSVAAWLDTVEGRHEEALAGARQVLEKAVDPLSLVVAPQLLAGHLWTLAHALAATRPERADAAARLLAVADGRLPPGHVPTRFEREVRGAAERTVRAALGDAAYATAYAAGDGLTWEEAVAAAGL
ncbi:BTAD domain-containing putative transcriptional regulator [Streptomyces longispororuber]|uniref:AfsR/SARP family transcriptional regulator n=1 Tax=Streptomyces longispororuber TaxID=68230 RepID=UPI0033FDC339